MGVLTMAARRGVILLSGSDLPSATGRAMRLREQGLQGALAKRLPAANRTHPDGRVCAADECDTRLSIYNGSKLCWQHAPVRIRLPRGRRRKWDAA